MRGELEQMFHVCRPSAQHVVGCRDGAWCSTVGMDATPRVAPRPCHGGPGVSAHGREASRAVREERPAYRCEAGRAPGFVRPEGQTRGQLPGATSGAASSGRWTPGRRRVSLAED